jgi:MFS family permease
MRLPIAIYPVSLVLTISARTGHYGFAGVLTAAYVIGSGVGNPVLARVADRLGQRRVLLPASVAHAVATVALVVLIEAGEPQWTYVSAAVVSGFTYLAVGSLVRARWTHVWGRGPQLNTAYSVESTLDEIIFTSGPLIATVIATTLDPILALAIALLLVLVGAVWLRALRATDPPVSSTTQPRRGSALRPPGMSLLLVSAGAIGALFGSAEVTIVAFCSQHGDRALAGVVLACLAAGSGTAGFIYGARTHRASLLRRFRFQALSLGGLPLLLLLAPNVPFLAACAFIVGLGVAPTMITASGLIEQIVDRSMITEGLAWLITGLNLGYGFGSAAVGGATDAYGARPAFLVSVMAGLLIAGTASVLHARATRMLAIV